MVVTLGSYQLVIFAVRRVQEPRTRAKEHQAAPPADPAGRLEAARAQTRMYLLTHPNPWN